MKHGQYNGSLDFHHDLAEVMDNMGRPYILLVQNPVGGKGAYYFAHHNVSSKLLDKVLAAFDG